MDVATQLAFDDDQRRVFDLANAGKNIVVIGRAGTGKSAVLNELKRTYTGNMAILAPTGLAARNVGGETISSFMHFPIVSPVQDGIDSILVDEYRREKFNGVDMIAEDETGMVNPSMFHKLSKGFCDAAEGAAQDLPFAGKQVVAFGDFHQLPPVARGEYGVWLRKRFGGIHAFNAPAWKDAGFKVVVLNQVHRQCDPEEIALLDSFREGPLSRSGVVDFPACVARLNKMCCKPYMPLDAKVTTLCTTRRMASEINQMAMNSLSGDNVEYRGAINGLYPPNDQPTDKTLRLKIGARVMILANDRGRGYVNGNMGVLVANKGSAAWVELDSGPLVEVVPFRWMAVQHYLKKCKDGTHSLSTWPIGSFYQMPLALAYAQTIHKCQGMTLDAVRLIIRGGRFFAAGQLYTALTRVRSLADLSFDRPLTVADCIVDMAVVAFRLNGYMA